MDVLTNTKVIMEIKKVYSYNSAFLHGQIVKTKYSSGCLRNVLMSHYGLRDEVAEIYSKLGEINELRYEASLEGRDDILSWEREKSLRAPIPGAPKNFGYSGRADFVVNHKDVGMAPHELKGTFSKTIRRECVRKDKVIMNHLAQLVSYMIFLESSTGFLVYAYYDRNKDDTFSFGEERVKEVKIDKDGHIFVDGMASEFCVDDYLSFRKAVVKVISEGLLWQRPEHWDMQWKSPCTYCVYKSVCNDYDAGIINSLEDFIKEARNYVEGSTKV